MAKILITGSSGFIGGFLTTHGINLGHEVYAGVRKTSNRRYLQHPSTKFFEVNFENMVEMGDRLQQERFDYIIHNAGKTKAPTKADYLKVNADYTINFAKELVNRNCIPKKFVFVSSLASIGPADASGVKIIDRNTPPTPVTLYGESKKAGEEGLRAIKDFPYMFIRPTAVFGPRDSEMFTLFEMINKGLEAYIGLSPQHLSFIYVKDLVECIYAALFADIIRGEYMVTDGKVYRSEIFYSHIKKALGKTRTLKIKVPIGILKVVATIMETFYSRGEKLPPLNREKLNELKARNWECDASPLKDELNFQAAYSLEEAIKETVDWYKKEAWL